MVKVYKEITGKALPLDVGTRFPLESGPAPLCLPPTADWGLHLARDVQNEQQPCLPVHERPPSPLGREETVRRHHRSRRVEFRRPPSHPQLMFPLLFRHVYGTDEREGDQLGHNTRRPCSRYGSYIEILLHGNNRDHREQRAGAPPRCVPAPAHLGPGRLLRVFKVSTLRVQLSRGEEFRRRPRVHRFTRLGEELRSAELHKGERVGVVCEEVGVVCIVIQLGFCFVYF